MTLLVALAMAIGGLAGAGSVQAAGAPLPKDPCALLKPTEIQALAPNAKIGAGVANTSSLPLGVSCQYTWGPRTKEWGESSLTISVIDASKAWPGHSADVLEEGIHTKVIAGGANASEISGVGDAGAFSFEARSSTATAEAYLKAKGVHLSVAFHGGDAPHSKDKLAALLKTAAARL